MRQAFSGVWVLLIASASASAADEVGPRLAESPLSTANLLQTAGGLLLVVGLMLVLAWLAKRYFRVPGAAKGQVQILGGVSLGAREKALLLSVEGRRLLVGVAPGRVQTLLELSGPPDSVTGFDEHLDQASAAIDSSRREVGS